MKIKTEGINAQGFGTIAKSAMTDQRLSVTAKCIYAYFCSFAGAGEQCFPSRKKICYDLNITANTYSKHLKTLTECGYISVKQSRDNGRWARNIYVLNNELSPCIKKQYTEISVSQKMVYDNLTTNNNNNTSNNIYKSSSSIDDGDRETLDLLTEEEIQDFKERIELSGWGEHKRVMLNGDQVKDLLYRLSLDEFDYYVEKLDSFIYNKNAKVRNHYKTILKWADADRGI